MLVSLLEKEVSSNPQFVINVLQEILDLLKANPTMLNELIALLKPSTGK